MHLNWWINLYRPIICWSLEPLFADDSSMLIQSSVSPLHDMLWVAKLPKEAVQPNNCEWKSIATFKHQWHPAKANHGKQCTAEIYEGCNETGITCFLHDCCQAPQWAVQQTSQELLKLISQKGKSHNTSALPKWKPEVIGQLFLDTHNRGISCLSNGNIVCILQRQIAPHLRAC